MFLCHFFYLSIICVISGIAAKNKTAITLMIIFANSITYPLFCIAVFRHRKHRHLIILDQIMTENVLITKKIGIHDVF